MEPKIINIDNIKEKLRIEPRINYSDLLITIFAFDLSSEDKIESLLWILEDIEGSEDI